MDVGQTAFYLNGDELAAASDLAAAIRALLPAYRPEARVRRLFVDEITAVVGWVKSLKRLLDAGELKDLLVVTTGSRATDLRRGVERLPGRKGRLDRTPFLFTPVPFREFRRVCGAVLGPDVLTAYMLSGGCPSAGAELAAGRRHPEHVPKMIRDWMLGECAASGRDRAALVAVLDVILVRGGTPVGQSLLAREAGLANNTVASGYLESDPEFQKLATAQ